MTIKASDLDGAIGLMAGCQNKELRARIEAMQAGFQGMLGEIAEQQQAALLRFNSNFMKSTKKGGSLSLRPRRCAFITSNKSAIKSRQ